MSEDRLPLNLFRPGGLLYLVGYRVPHGLEPLAAAELVVPPLTLDPGDVVSSVKIAGPLVLGTVWFRPWRHLAAEAELIYVTLPAVRTFY